MAIILICCLWWWVLYKDRVVSSPDDHSLTGKLASIPAVMSTAIIVLGILHVLYAYHTAFGIPYTLDVHWVMVALNVPYLLLHLVDLIFPLVFLYLHPKLRRLWKKLLYLGFKRSLHCFKCLLPCLPPEPLIYVMPVVRHGAVLTQETNRFLSARQMANSVAISCHMSKMATVEALVEATRAETDAEMHLPASISQLIHFNPARDTNSISFAQHTQDIEREAGGVCTQAPLQISVDRKLLTEGKLSEDPKAYETTSTLPNVQLVYIKPASKTARNHPVQQPSDKGGTEQADNVVGESFTVQRITNHVLSEDAVSTSAATSELPMKARNHLKQQVPFGTDNELTFNGVTAHATLATTPTSQSLPVQIADKSTLSSKSDKLSLSSATNSEAASDKESTNNSLDEEEVANLTHSAIAKEAVCNAYSQRVSLAVEESPHNVGRCQNVSTFPGVRIIFVEPAAGQAQTTELEVKQNVRK